MSSKDFSEDELQKLVRSAQSGDTECFGKIYDLFFDQIYRYASFRVPDEMAEDIVADIFVKGWEKIHSYKSKKNVPFGAWLFRIARHSVIDAYRMQQEIEEVPEDIVDSDEFNQADSLVKRTYLLKTVRKALRELPQKQREILELSFMAELPNSEIARVLNMREGAVRTMKFRALQKLEILLPTEMRENM
ncbi:MAG: sigma-70 family RNA polymerase sigma factor [Candidatus Peribacteraceae bacterium]|nr:sigma-70 family RNA polymerase sigma factor [Candidatus Peribacteraceae bacterium]